MANLTVRQKEVLEYISSFIDKEGYAPSYQDIASFFNFSSVASVRTHLELLEKKGYIKRQGKARSIKVLRKLHSETIPILGHIAAGQPIAGIEDDLGTIQDLEVLKYDPERFALKIKGDSMKNAGILNGDIAIIQKGLRVSNHDIAAVAIEGAATLKRIYFEDQAVRLKAENEFYDDIIITADQFDSYIIGKYIALIRDIKC